MLLWWFAVRENRLCWIDWHTCTFASCQHLTTAYQQLQYSVNAQRWTSLFLLKAMAMYNSVAMTTGYSDGIKYPHTHKQMQNWLTLHNTAWIVRFLFGNADERESSIAAEDTRCRARCNHPTTDAMLLSFFTSTFVNYTDTFTFTFQGQKYFNFQLNTFSHLVFAGDKLTEGGWMWVAVKHVQ